MQFGLKNRLRLISLLPILLLFAITTYFAYTSFINYNAAKELQSKLSENKQLSDLIGNISRERGMTVIYLGNSSPNTLSSLLKQRKNVDDQSTLYLSNMNLHLESHDDSDDKSSCETCANTQSISASIDSIKEMRKLVDEQKASFKEVYEEVYGSAQHNAILQLEALTKNQTDEEIKELSDAYTSLVHIKAFTAEERDLISYTLARSSTLQAEELNLWISLIGKSAFIAYDTLTNKELGSKLTLIFKDEDNVELINDINEERTAILSLASTGEYELGSGIWFTMLSEKVNIISNAQETVLKAMDERASQAQTDALQILILSITVWFTSIVMGMLGYLLSNEIASNIKNLENVLRGVAEDTRDTHGHAITIDLHSSSGTAEAYKLLETIIQQTRDDKVAAQEASEAKSMFLANMSHEIRTPLNGIVGFTELLKDTGLEEEQAEFVEIIEKSSENLLEIINNILDLSKIESNKLEIEDIIFNPIEEFESAVEVYAVRASEKHIDLGCFIDPELEQPLKGDPTKIKEVIINLLSNAVKFTSSSGSINVNIRRVESQQAGITKVMFEVQDSGIGVTSEQKSKIFEAFSQADTSITRKYGGTGLGLTISSRFIELMGGELDLHSETGEGTTFFFSIEFEEIETLNETNRGNFSNINALLLEDAHKPKAQAIYLKEYLDFYGVSYTIFKDKSELESLQSRVDYDLLFVDYDYCTDVDNLQNYASQTQEFILLTKATYIRKLDALNLNTFKTLFEPLTNSKVKALLDNYHSQNFKLKQSKKTNRTKFNADTSKFNANVLIAEDNIINQKLIKRTLEDIGLTITIANNGLDAFQKRKDGNFDLMFMDIQMPFLDGVEATQEILEYEEDYNQVHVPIIALTANALKGDRERFLAAGLDEYTTKPLVRSEIISLLNHFLADHIIEVKTEDVTQSDEVIVEELALEPIIEEVKEVTTFVEVEITEEAIIEESTIDIVEEEILEPVETEDLIPEILEHTYKADILLAKKSLFESKLFAKLLDSMGYSYDVAHSNEEIQSFVEASTYKVILFDKECEGLDLPAFSKKVKDSNESKQLSTSLILISDPSSPEAPEDKVYVHETIKNVVNKDLLRLVFEKFI
ncbi:MAG: signal transduction histidine kinase/CheY-like chemotaxis protein [Sulfurimonas sp.]|jgi:signal transduction histidine kinase/CheY-like chemotaxis protein|uniref:hybrid sensor histidine kinase/response regulator n=1 Tax=Sulfurimonas sp. TaxID=2022749 RepID=UPI0039E4D052